MKKTAVFICLLLILTLCAGLLSACGEISEAASGHDCQSGIWFLEQTKISSFATNIPEDPIIIRNDEDLQNYLYAYIYSHPENKARTNWIISYLGGFGHEFFDTRAFVLVRDGWHFENQTGYAVCGVSLEENTLVVNIRYIRSGGAETGGKKSNSYILSVMKKDIDGVTRTGIIETDFTDKL